MIQGAVRPSHRSAATNVCVRQWPNGAHAISRRWRRARPCSRVIFVVVAVSSTKTRRCGSWRMRGCRPLPAGIAHVIVSAHRRHQRFL